MTVCQPPNNTMLRIDVALTVQAAAYASGDLICALIELPNAAELKGGAGYIVGAVLQDEAAQDVDYDLVLFDSDPSSGSTFTINSAPDVADACLAKAIGFVNIDTFCTFADNAILRGEPDMPIPFILDVTNGTTSLWALLITRGAPTYAATTDLTLQVWIRRA